MQQLDVARPRRAPRPVVLMLALVAVAAVAVVVARRVDAEDVIAMPAATELPIGPLAPAIGPTDWLNSAPLGPSELAGRVVLYDFWTFGCVNCRNTLPHVKAWHARYAADGLVVLSVHTPEFPREADPRNVAEFVAEEGVAYPVALDPDRVIWRSFSNRYWPAFYLHDRDGHRRYRHFGEGAYDLTEDAIRQLLGVDPGSPRAVVA